MNNKINFIVKSQSVALSTMIVGISSILLRFISLFNNFIIAKKFGTSKELDIFLASQSIVDFIIAMLTLTFGVVFIPFYSELIIKKKYKQAKELADSLTILLLLFSIFCVIFLFLTSSSITKIFFGFKQNENILAINLLKISSISIIPFVLFGQINSILNSQKKFFLPTIIITIFSFSPGICIILFSSAIGIYSLSLSVIIYSFGIASILLFLIANKKNKSSLKINFKNSSLIKILKISLPLIVSASAVQLNTLIDRIFASNLPTGSISSLNYARIIRDIPLTLTAALPLVILPFFSEKVFTKKEIDLSNLLSRVLRIGSYILIPSTVGLFVISNYLIQILYERGTFSETSKEMTLSSLYYLLPGLVFYWFITILTRLFYAKKRFNTVIIIGLLAIFFNISMDWLLIQFLSFKGIALTTSLMEFTFFIVYIVLSKKILISFNLRHLFMNLSKIIGASVFMGICLIIIMKNYNLNQTIPDVLIFLRLLLFIFLGIVIYIFSSILIKIEEFKYLLNKISFIKKQ